MKGEYVFWFFMVWVTLLSTSCTNDTRLAEITRELREIKMEIKTK